LALAEGRFQLYFVLAGIIPFTPSVGVTWNGVPLQVTAVIGSKDPVGFTVTMSVKLFPTQASDLGVIE
jgi:hypothetical protein